MTNRPLDGARDDIRMNDIGTFLARLGGADPEVLAETTGERGRFIQMGLVLLSTAGLAVLSMTYALIVGLSMPVAGAVVLGLVWGAVIINLDRLLILTMKPAQSGLRLAMMIAPRILMAALLGIVIATPLTLRIFESEIRARMILDNAHEAQVQGDARSKDPRYGELEAVKADIAKHEGYLRGGVPYSSPELELAQTEYDAAATDLAEKQKAYNAKNLEWRCERFGERCAGGSGEFGDGARAQALKQELDQRSTALAAAQRTMDAKRADLTRAQDQNKASTAEKLAADQAEANRELPELRERRDTLERDLGNLTDNDSNTLEQSTGLLARIDALGRLGQESWSARAAHWSVAGVLFMVELLPVLVKALSLMGGRSQYDRVSELLDTRVMDRASGRHSWRRRRQQKADQKAEEIEDDMLDHEVALGKRANAYVASEMTKILDIALRDWSSQVARTPRGGGPSGQGGPPGPPRTPGPRRPPPQGPPPPQGGSGFNRFRERLRLPWRKKP